MNILRKINKLFSTNQRFTSAQCIKLQSDYSCNNYSPLPIVIESASGMYVTDCQGKKYIDFISAYSAVNQGHLHPRIMKTFIEQSQKMTLTSRAVHNNLLGLACKRMHDIFGYDKTLFMNTGVEAGQSAIKFARRWGYVNKKVQQNQATVLFAKGNFWGRTIAACASSDDPDRFYNFGPFNGLNFELIDYGSVQSLESQLKKNKNIVAYMMEPIQGQKGVVIPPQGYMTKVRELCSRYNVLLIFDEIQTGLGRTGKLLASMYQNVRPDMVLLGKALSGGFLPISAVLCDNFIMNNIKPGEHGSTYGGNPLACAVAITSLDVLLEEKMSQNSQKAGQQIISFMRKLFHHEKVKEIRGKGLFIGVEFEAGSLAYKFSKILMKNGLIAKPTQQNIIRFSPPLIISKEDIKVSQKIIQKSWNEFTHALNETPAYV